MSSVRSSPTRGEERAVAFDADLAFLRRFAGPDRSPVARDDGIHLRRRRGRQDHELRRRCGLHARARSRPALLPLVILTELGGGLLVLAGFKTRWAAVALAGFCLLTAVIFHLASGETIEFQKNVAMAGGFLLLAVFGPGAWSIDGRFGRAE